MDNNKISKCAKQCNYVQSKQISQQSEGYTYSRIEKKRKISIAN